MCAEWEPGALRGSTDHGSVRVKNQGHQVETHRADRLPGVKGTWELSAEAARMNKRDWLGVAYMSKVSFGHCLCYVRATSRVTEGGF